MGPNIENKTRVVCRNLILCLALLCISLFFGPYHDGVVSLTLFGKAIDTKLVSILFLEEDYSMIDEQNSRVSHRAECRIESEEKIHEDRKTFDGW